LHFIVNAGLSVLCFISVVIDAIYLFIYLFYPARLEELPSQLLGEKL